MPLDAQDPSYAASQNSKPGHSYTGCSKAIRLSTPCFEMFEGFRRYRRRLSTRARSGHYSQGAHEYTDVLFANTQLASPAAHEFGSVAEDHPTTGADRSGHDRTYTRLADQEPTAMPIPQIPPQMIVDVDRRPSSVDLESLGPIARGLDGGLQPPSRVERAMNKAGVLEYFHERWSRELTKAMVGDRLDDQSLRPELVSEVKDAVQALTNGISTFLHDVHWLVKVLDEVARIHPFVAGMDMCSSIFHGYDDEAVIFDLAPILAFKAVYTMERTRQENDKRIISLYVAMKDMIAVLVQ